ncbi:type IV pilus modification PilV family protein [Nocardioides bruguierae]|uniref:type IV pilus modification PilV family protein n=1 Tax=Nocardioides bruguierae TaxID=2945102 RepID=UPI0020213419|nr:type II secretion system protein [Nocardioides bruguierae]MCL8027636.1 type II secretion system GspH family protein [Nocardioides bruguierae]
MPSDGGFSLVEIMVSVGILVVVLVATLPVILSGIRGNATSRELTQAKSLALGQLEQMRNLPFHVAPDAGDYIDVLDRYYTDLTTPATAPACTDADGDAVAPTSASDGFVAAGATRCSWEPDGAFYRRVITDAEDGDLDGWTVVVATQLLSDGTPPTVVVPASGWTTQVVGRDARPASQIGVGVTVLRTGATLAPVSSWTQISRTRQAATRLRASVDVTTLAVGTSTPTVTGEVPVNVDAGRLQLATGLSYASTASGTASSVAADVGTSLTGRGATADVVAPPAATVAAQGAGESSLGASGCQLACWGGTQTTSLAARVAEALPGLGSALSPVGATLASPSSSGTALGVGAGTGSLLLYRDGLALTGRLVKMTSATVPSATGSDCSVSTSGGSVRLSATGWATSTATDDTTDPSAVEACGTARAGTVQVLPTTFAPEGILQVDLTGAAARCRVAGTGHAASTTAAWSATVRRWTPTGYVAVTPTTPTTTQASTTDALEAIDLSTVPVGTYGYLDDWIASWSALTVGETTRTASGGAAEVTIPGVITLRTQPLRKQVDSDGAVVTDEAGQPVAEPSSTLSVTLGAVSCTAQDDR